MMLVCLYACLTLATVAEIRSFQSVIDMGRWVADNPEYPDTDGLLSTIRLPAAASFNRFLHDARVGWFGSLLQRVGMRSIFWRFEQFDARLHRISVSDSYGASATEYRMMSIQATNPDRPVKIIIVGNIGGNMHGLYRLLGDMIARGILDDQLKLTGTDTYCIFLGDIIGASPYNLETLDAVLLFLERNSGKSFCIRGWSESNQRWQLFPMIAELRTKSSYTEAQLREFIRRLDSFFIQLPAALLITGADKSEGILCAPREVRQSMRMDQLVRCVARLDREPVAECPILDQAPDTTDGTTAAMKLLAKFSTTIFEDTYYPMSLLHMFIEQESVPVWHCISTPSPFYRALYRCRYEGYCICDVRTILAQTTCMPIAKKIGNDGQYTLYTALRVTDTSHALVL